MLIFFVEKIWEAFAMQKLLSFLQQKLYDSAFGYKILNHLTSWALNDLVKLNNALNNWALVTYW